MCNSYIQMAKRLMEVFEGIWKEIDDWLQEQKLAIAMLVIPKSGTLDSLDKLWVLAHWILLIWKKRKKAKVTVGGRGRFQIFLKVCLINIDSEWNKCHRICSRTRLPTACLSKNGFSALFRCWGGRKPTDQVGCKAYGAGDLIDWLIDWLIHWFIVDVRMQAAYW